MNFSLISCGLPGTGYHGGAVTCWAIAKAMIARGHKVTVLSLFDNSELNPYLESRKTQTTELYKLGIKVEFIDHNYKELSSYDDSTISFMSIMRKGTSFFNPSMGRFFPWAKLKGQVQEKLKMIKPDAIFCYHFDALSAVYNTNIAPIMAGVGDLWHLPRYFRWRIKKSSIRKYLLEYPYQLGVSKISKELMLEMLRPCAKRGAFAAHYADWLRRQKGFSDTLYLRTPAHDPVGDSWCELREQHSRNNEKPKILMIGDVTGTAAGWGLKLLIKEVLPVLERKYGVAGFEIHLVGGGKIDDEFSLLMKLPYVKMRGRIVPSDAEFLSSDVLFIPTPITLGIRVKIITGFSYGSCIVAHKANIAGIPEIRHECNALVSNSGMSLAEEMVRAIENKDLRKKLEEKARYTFEEYFSEKTAGENIVKEIEILV